MITKSLHNFICISLLSVSAKMFAANPDVVTEVEQQAESISRSKSEKVEVTGSRLKRVEAEGMVPIVLIDRAQLERSGFSTLSDVIREIPLSSFGATREQSNRTAPGFAGANLRGLGGKYTLVLLDGHRLASDPVFDAVDLSEIPTGMIERIEILKAGASAIYGSDAIGGVINVITRKDFKGVSASTSLSQPADKGGSEHKFEVVGGGDIGPFRVTAVASYRDRDAIYAKDRSFVGDGWSPIGSPGSFIPITKVTKDGKDTWTTKGNLRADPKCQNTTLTRLNTSAGDQFCEYNYEGVRTISPSLEQKGLMFKSEMDLNDSLKVYAVAKGTYRSTKDIVAPVPASNVDVTDRAAVVAIKNALGDAGSEIDAEAGNGVRINYRTAELGLRENLSNDLNMTGIVGFKGNVAVNWDWDLSYSDSRFKREDRGEKGYWNQDVLLRLIKDGRFNPFDKNAASTSIDEARYVPIKNQETDVRQTTLILTGDVAETASGPVAIAFGLSHVSEKYSTGGDDLTLARKVPGASSSNGRGERETKAIFAEASVPLTTSWELSLAARSDDYPKYGTGFSPRLSSSYKGSDWLVRGSVGTGFRAPTLQEENVTENSGYPNFVDNLRCRQARESGNPSDILSLCKESQYLLKVVAAEELKTEKVLMANLGTVYSPNRTFNFGLDAWYIRIKDRIGVPDLNLLTAAEASGQLKFQNYGIEIRRDGKGRIIEIVSPAANLARQEVAGIDLDAGTKVGSENVIQLGWQIDSSYQIFNREAAFDGQPLQERIGEADRPQWRANNTFSLRSLKNHELSVTSRSTSSVKKVNPDLGKMPVHTEYDTQYRLDKFFGGSLSVGVLNLTNSKPPKDESNNPALSYEIYSYAGSTYYASLVQKF